MKKRLLLLIILLCSTFSFSQITYSSFSNLNITNTTATVRTLVDYNCASEAGFYIWFSTDPSFSNAATIRQNYLGGFLSSQYVSASMIGLLPGTTYYYKYVGAIDYSCGNNIVESSIQSFTTLVTAPNSELANYTFNNTLFDSNNSNPFNIPGKKEFVVFSDDRNLTTNNALNTPFGIFATLTSLPTGNSPRTIALWYKVDSNQGNNKSIFNYGTTNATGLVKLELGNNGNPIFNNFDFGGSYPSAVWRQIVVTYDGTNVSLFMNSSLLSSQAMVLNTGIDPSSFNFTIGNSTTNITIDDLKIYNYALSQAEVTNLYNRNTLGIQDFNAKNLKLSLYPNPVTDYLNVDTTDEVKSVTIYGLLGNKIIETTTNPVNVSQLSKGIYLVRVEDSNGKVATQKIVKE